MADTIFQAFMSCSFEKEDKKTRDFFGKLIRSFDIEPKFYDYQEIGKLPDKVKENILLSDCLIAIATRRQKIEGSECWTCPAWIQHEMAVANAYKKPIAIFVEEGVKMEGLIEKEERRVEFNKNDLLANFDRITTFLFNLRKYLEATYQTERLQIPVLLRHYFHAREEMRSKELSVLSCEILMESLIPELGSTHHSIELEETTPGLSVKPIQFDFICKEKPANMRVDFRIIQETDYKFLWHVIFDPPLKKSEKVKYAFKVVSHNNRPYTYEDMLERIKQGTYEYKEQICEACEWFASYPTLEFLYDFEFPEGYEIRKSYPDVKIGYNVRMTSKDEVKKILDGNFFKAEKIFDKWVLSLRIPKPIQNYIYYIFYEPPRRNEVK